MTDCDLIDLIFTIIHIYSREKPCSSAFYETLEEKSKPFLQNLCWKLKLKNIVVLILERKGKEVGERDAMW